MPPGATVREMRDEDIDQVIALWHAAGVARPWNDPQTDIAFARRGQHSTILVTEMQGHIVASAMVGEDGHRGWVYYVAADPRHQGTGLGKNIMAAAEHWLRNRGVWKVQLLVREGNERVRRFYERLGYHDTGSVCFQKLLPPQGLTRPDRGSGKTTAAHRNFPSGHPLIWCTNGTR